MAAVPKKKPSQTRNHSRHSAWRKRQTDAFMNTVSCDNCGQIKFPHRVCKNCGYYKGKMIVAQKTRVRSVAA